MRQALAHPVSELLATAVIVLVLWFGGTLILDGDSSISASSFIYYLTILYSVINPLKELSKASYNIPRGLASMERVDEILNADNPITDVEIYDDPYDVRYYDDPDDFADEWAEEFGDGDYDDGYDDAYEYWEDHYAY